MALFLYLYLSSIHKESFSFGKKEWNHFLPSASIVIALPLPFVDEMVIYRFYQLVVAQILVYILMSLWFHRSVSKKGPIDPLKVKWGYILIGGTALIWIAFFAQLIIDTFMLYLTATSIAAFVLYGVSFLVMKNRLSFKKNGRLTRFNGDAAFIYQKIKKTLGVEKLYQDPELTIDKLSASVKSQPYLVSMVINEKFKKTFPEFINSYRVEEARKMFESGSTGHLSIESIAYDSGFNSISSFYISFKKICKTTPAEYRKQFQP